MSVLDSIIEGVRANLAARRLSMAQLREQLDQVRPPLDALTFFSTENISVIAEVKRSSPSKGALAQIPNPAALAQRYQGAGASAISVLTEQQHFGGSIEDLVQVRAAVAIPILRKDFMIDEYQFYEARAIGADLVLLIVAALSANQLDDYHSLTRELGMRALVEVHTRDELERALEISPDIVGVNSRSLKTLAVDLIAFSNLIPLIPKTLIRVAESGISTRKDVQYAQECGATAILVGERLVKSDDPRATMRDLQGLA